MPVNWDLSMTVSPAKILSVSSAEEFLSEMKPLIMQPWNLIGLKSMKGIEDELSGWSDASDTGEGVVVFTNLPLKMRIEHDLAALNFRPAQVRAVMHWESKVWAPETVEDIRLRSSMKTHSKGNAVYVAGKFRDPGLHRVFKYDVHTCLERNYSKSAASKNSPLMSMPRTCSWFRKSFTENPFVTCVNESNSLRRDTISI